MIPDEIRRMKPMEGKDRLGAERDSEYMGVEDIEPGTEPVLTIQNLYRGMVTLSRGKEKKELITFAEESVPGIRIVRPLIVNKTNRMALKKIYKNVTAETLTGKRVQLYIDPNVRNPSTGEKDGGIRIRDRMPTAAKYEAPKCEECGKAITGMSGFTPEQVASANKQRYGKCLCIECGKKRKAELEQQAAAEAEQTEPSLAERLAAEMEV